MKDRQDTSKLKGLDTIFGGGFSTSLIAGSSQQPCPVGQVPVVPCNLRKLVFTEPNAEPQKAAGARVVEYYKGGQRRRFQTPTILTAGQDVFQVTAKSKSQAPRIVEARFDNEAVCSSTRHPMVAINGPGENEEKISAEHSFSFHRKPQPGDDNVWPLGIMAILDAVYSAIQRPAVYNITGMSCGLPASAENTSVTSLNGRIEVFPADKFDFELELPALLKPDSLSYKTKTDTWETPADIEARKRREEADRYYEDYEDFLRKAGTSRSDVRQFYEDIAKKASGADDSKYAEKIKVKITQTDGNRRLEAPVSDIVNLVRMIRSAERQLKAIQKWVKNAQIGPGCSFSIECQFLIGKLVMEWGYVEYYDDRVYLAYKGSLDLDIAKVKLEFTAGFRTAGLADLLLILSGKGTISISVAQLKKDDPDEEPKADAITPKGEIKFTGKLEGCLFWIVKGEIGVETALKAKVDLKLLTKETAFGGKVTLSRDPVYGKISAQSRFYGSSSMREELIPGDPNLAQFTFF